MENSDPQAFEFGQQLIPRASAAKVQPNRMMEGKGLEFCEKSPRDGHVLDRNTR